MIKNITAILGVLAAVASLSLADSAPEASAQDTKKMVQNNFVETAQKGIKITYNKIDGANHFFDKHEADVVETVKDYVSNMMSNPLRS